MPPARASRGAPGEPSLVTELAGTAGDGKAATALKEFGAEAGKAGSAADPGTAADNPAMEKAGKDINAACRTAGAPTTF